MTGYHSPDKKPKLYDSGYDGMHMDNLFDEDESVFGDRIDPATGLPYDNSTATDEQLFQEGSARQIGHVVTSENDARILRSANPEDAAAEAAADAWLAQHDNGPQTPRAAV